MGIVAAAVLHETAQVLSEFVRDEMRQKTHVAKGESGKVLPRRLRDEMRQKTHVAKGESGKVPPSGLRDETDRCQPPP
jgi:hypothetical protein